MTCRLCHGQMTEKTITVDLRVNGKQLIVEGVPAKVCDTCGEKVFTPAALKSFRTWPSSEKNHPELDEFLYSPWKKAGPEINAEAPEIKNCLRKNSTYFAPPWPDPLQSSFPVSTSQRIT